MRSDREISAREEATGWAVCGAAWPRAWLRRGVPEVSVRLRRGCRSVAALLVLPWTPVLASARRRTLDRLGLVSERAVLARPGRALTGRMLRQPDAVAARRRGKLLAETAGRYRSSKIEIVALQGGPAHPLAHRQLRSAGAAYRRTKRATTRAAAQVQSEAPTARFPSDCRAGASMQIHTDTDSRSKHPPCWSPGSASRAQADSFYRSRLAVLPAHRRHRLQCVMPPTFRDRVQKFLVCNGATESVDRPVTVLGASA